jgi:hypothetical protein
LVFAQWRAWRAAFERRPFALLEFWPLARSESRFAAAIECGSLAPESGLISQQRSARAAAFESRPVAATKGWLAAWPERRPFGAFEFRPGAAIEGLLIASIKGWLTA